MANEWGKIQLSCIAKLRSGFPFKSSSWVDDGVPVIKIANVKDGRIDGEFVESELGPIPKGWDVKLFSEVVQINPKVYIVKGTIAPYVEIADLPTSSARVLNWRYREFSGSGSRFMNGDILLARLTPCLENGKTALVDFLKSDEVGWGSTEFIVLRPLPPLSGIFLYYLARSEDFRAHAIQSTTGTTRQRIQKEFLGYYKIITPPVAEQRAIAHILGTLDEKIELNRQMNQTLEAIAQAIFKSWFVDFDPVRAKAEGREPAGINPEIAALFPDRFVNSELGEIPEGWRIKSLDQIANYLNGLPLQKYPPKDNKSLPVIKIAELRKGITESTDRASAEIDKEYIINDGDILFSWSGSLEICIWCGGRGALNQHLFKVTSEIYPRWFYYLWTKEYLPEFRRIASAKATTMGHIQRYHLTEALVLVPSAKLLEKMNKVIEPFFKLIVCNNVQSRTLAQIRDTLLPKLLSGEIRVKEAEKFVEANL
jgi:type I restriction enzyme S subunit